MNFLRRALPYFLGCLLALPGPAPIFGSPIFPPSLPPIADADPTVRAEQEVLVPTALKAVRTADVLVLTDDFDPKPKKLSVGSKMVLGMSTTLYVYPVGGVRPAHGTLRSLGGLPGNASKGASYLYPKSETALASPGPVILEMEVVIFETDIPPQHMWSPGGGKYKVLWQTTLRQTVEVQSQLPQEIRAHLEKMKSLTRPAAN